MNEELLKMCEDLTPVPLDDTVPGDVQVCRIMYSREFREAMSYFRAILRRQELTQRALLVTAATLEANPTCYTAWHYRRQVLCALLETLMQEQPSEQHREMARTLFWSREIEFTETAASNMPKNYQIWFHRQRILELSGAIDMRREMAHTAALLQGDSKNYHAWSHRQWALAKCTEAEHLRNELSFCASLLRKDVRNNSAWNERFFALRRLLSLDAAAADEIVQAELAFVAEKVDLLANNESPWSYLSGLLSLHDGIRAQVSQLAVSQPAVPFALSLRLDLLAEDSSTLAERTEIYNELVRLDPLRAKYWKFEAARAGVSLS
ncbi:MAG: hypothetical protein MHM6MM_002294 [Cercozoa sp. M6MM]